MGANNRLSIYSDRSSRDISGVYVRHEDNEPIITNFQRGFTSHQYEAYGEEVADVDTLMGGRMDSQAYHQHLR